MTTEAIIELIVSILPSIIAIFTTIGVIVKVIKQFADLKKEVANMKAIEDLRDQMKQVLEENYTLKKTLNETMTMIDHVERK